jgi:hypothetical protein
MDRVTASDYPLADKALTEIPRAEEPQRSTTMKMKEEEREREREREKEKL